MTKSNEPTSAIFDQLAQLQRWRVTAACEEKARYASEAMARDVGGRRAKEAGIDLWIYHCAFCAGYHLTSSPRASHWHVHTKFHPSNDYEAITGDPFFWDRLVDMEFSEAHTYLRRVRSEVVNTLNHASGEDEVRLHRMLARITEELRILSDRKHKHEWTEAVRLLYGEDGLAMVRIEMARIKHEMETTT